MGLYYGCTALAKLQNLFTHGSNLVIDEDQDVFRRGARPGCEVYLDDGD